MPLSNRYGNVDITGKLESQEAWLLEAAFHYNSLKYIKKNRPPFPRAQSWPVGCNWALCSVRIQELLFGGTESNGRYLCQSVFQIESGDG